jgi:hypothetical protein
MTKNQLSIAELRERIEKCAQPGGMDERTALVWHGYLAAAAEWGLISIPESDDLNELLPRLSYNPAIALLTGRREDAYQK